METRTIVLAVVAVTAGVFASPRPHNGVLSDLRDAVADNALGTLKTEAGAETTGVNVMKPVKPFYVETGSGKESSVNGHAVGGAPSRPFKWVTIKGGKFKMGTDSLEEGFDFTKPVHEVAIETFDMSETDVTVEQYKECVIKGECTEPGRDKYCNWGVKGRQRHPVNCVDWKQAQTYAEFKSKQPGFEGARLPSEAEWEYAATSGGRSQKYPWGDEEPTCKKAVMYGNGGGGCGNNSTMPVCSKTAGNTAQGLCDMAGNVWQWVQDTFQHSYKGAPIDGSAFRGTDYRVVLRGGSHGYNETRFFRAHYRATAFFDSRDYDIGFRLARSGR